MTIVMLLAAGAMFAMYGIWASLAVFISYFTGIVGWAQLVGSIRYRKVRGPKLTALTVLVWLVIFAAFTAAVYFLLSRVFVAYLVGLAISLVAILLQKDIR